jgi:hypothetical protein
MEFKSFLSGSTRMPVIAKLQHIAGDYCWYRIQTTQKMKRRSSASTKNNAVIELQVLSLITLLMLVSLSAWRSNINYIERYSGRSSLLDWEWTEYHSNDRTTHVPQNFLGPSTPSHRQRISLNNDICSSIHSKSMHVSRHVPWTEILHPKVPEANLFHMTRNINHSSPAKHFCENLH